MSSHSGSAKQFNLLWTCASKCHAIIESNSLSNLDRKGDAEAEGEEYVPIPV